VSSPSALPATTDVRDDETPLAASILHYVNILRPRLWIVAVVVVVITTATTLYTMSRSKVYAATATVVINPRAPRVMGAQTDDVIELGNGSFWSNQEYYNTQSSIIKGFPLARATMLKRSKGVLFYEALAPKTKYPQLTEEQRIDAAAEAFKRMLAVKQTKDSRVVGITVRHTDRDLARDLANEQVRSYIAATLAKRTGGSDKSSRYLSVELDNAEKTLRDTEQRLYEFKDKNDIISVSLEDKQSILAADISRYSSAFGDARVKRIEMGALRQRALALKGEDVLESPVFSLASNSETVDLFKNQYIGEKQKFLEIQTQFGPKSEPYLQGRKKVDELYAQIQAEARRAMRELDERYQAAVAAESAFEAEVERLKKEALALGPLAVEYNRLARTKKTDEENYNLLHSRLNVSKLEGRNEQINVDELEYARVAIQVYPRMVVSVTIAIFLSLLLGVGIVISLHHFDRTIKSAEDVDRFVGAPMLGVIPVLSEISTGSDDKSQRDRDLYVFGNPTSRAAECCRSIQTNILFSAADRPMKVITVSSPRPREGKSTSTIYMGTTMAQSGQKVLLIDTDLRRPRLHKALGVSRTRGLTTLLLGDAEIGDVVKSTEVPNLYVLPCGPLPPNPVELLLSNRFKQILTELATRFDRVLLDSPPILAVTDAVVLSRLSDGVMLIAKAGETQISDVTLATKQFREVNAPILGVILNDMDITDRRYGYYQYAYGSQGETATSEGLS